MSHKTQGTKEWAYKNLNTHKGCPNGCKYCYAKKNAIRFKRIKSEEEWRDMKPNMKKIEKDYRKLNNPTDLYDYMYPTSHDITTENIEECIIVLLKVLSAGNSVLITTKPDQICIEQLCLELEDYKDLICFRFTITSMNDYILKRWEPYAPKFNERLDSLEIAYNEGYITSVSIEPFLDSTLVPLINKIIPYVNDTIWIGIMSGAVPKELKSNYTKVNLNNIIRKINELPEEIRNKIRLKDSIRNKVRTKLLREKIKETPKKPIKRLDKWLR